MAIEFTTLVQDAEGQGDLAAQLQDVAARSSTIMENAWGWLVEQGPAQAIALAVFAGLFVALRIMRSILCGLFRVKKEADHSLRNIISSVIGQTNSLFLLILSAVLVAPFVADLPDSALTYVSTAFMVAFVIQGAIWIRTLIAGASSGYLESHSIQDGGPGSTAATLIKTLSGFAIWAIAFAMILTNLGYEIGPIIAGLGVGGLAVGLAAQNIFKDLFSTLAIIFDKPFVRGDFITFDNGAYMGDVEKIGMKTTRIRSLTGEQIIIANAHLLDKEIRNYRRMERRRGSFDLGLVYQTPHEKLRDVPALVEDAINNVEGATFDRCRFEAFGNSALSFTVVFWFESRDYAHYLKAQENILFGVHQRFEAKGLEFAYPTRTIHMASQ